MGDLSRPENQTARTSSRTAGEPWPLNNHFAERNRMLSSAFSKLRMYERRINPKNRWENGWFSLRRTNAAVARCGSGGTGRLYGCAGID